jgi:hypothetical protein
MNFADRLFKNTQVSNFIKICPVGAKLFHVNKQTMTQLTVIFRNFANMAKINHHVGFYASATVQMRPLLFRDVTQCRYMVTEVSDRLSVPSSRKNLCLVGA